jgi:biotin carboxylase
MKDQDLVLVIGSGSQKYREYLLRGAAERHPLWLIDTAEPTWQAAYIKGSTVIPWLDSRRLIPDSERIIEAAEALSGEHRITGVLTYDEVIVMTAARIAELLRLPGLTVAGANRCRNKQLTRELLTGSGLCQPAFALATTLTEARAAAKAIGYPVVLKPRGMGASIGVVRADSAAGIEAAFGIAEHASHQGAPAYEGGVLVEELLTGPEISIDGAVADGEYRPFFLARKRVGLPPSFEEIGHVLDAADELLTSDDLHLMLSRAHHALGLETGITHTEVLLTGRGPAIVEVNARFGGDLIPYLGLLATGIDPGALAMDLVTGGRPSLAPRRKDCVGIRFLYPPEDCRVLGVTAPAPGSVPGLLEARVMAAPGDELRLPPRSHLGRYACVICSASSVAECDKRLDAGAEAVALDFEKLAE